jgi:predicted nucleotidyltransferase
MSRVRDVLVQALTDLSELSIPHAVIGGLAVSARVEPRMTRDVDVAVAVTSDAEAEEVIYALQNRGYVVEAVVEQVATGRMATARLRPVGAGTAGVVLDLLFASSGIEPELVAAAEIIPIVAGTTAPVATAGHLIALKLLAQSEARPQDAPDLKRLAAAANSDDLHQARQAVRLITQRGYARGRALEHALDMLVREMRPS